MNVRLYTGFDQREAVGWHVFTQSLMAHASSPVEIIPLYGDQADGTNAFTYARFRIPEMQNFGGWAIFVDAADMLMQADIAELWALRDQRYAVQVVKHDYRTKHPFKYVGTTMEAKNEDYPRKNWSSVVLWNCSHMAHVRAAEKLRGTDGAYLHRFSWLKDDEIGELPAEWNWLADEYGANTAAKLLHWTAGIPAIRAYARSPHAQAWCYHAAMAKEAPLERMMKASSK